MNLKKALVPAVVAVAFAGCGTSEPSMEERADQWMAEVWEEMAEGPNGPADQTSWCILVDQLGPLGLVNLMGQQEPDPNSAIEPFMEDNFENRAILAEAIDRHAKETCST